MDKALQVRHVDDQNIIQSSETENHTNYQADVMFVAKPAWYWKHSERSRFLGSLGDVPQSRLESREEMTDYSGLRRINQNGTFLGGLAPRLHVTERERH